MSSYVSTVRIIPQISVDEREWDAILKKVRETDTYVMKKQEEKNRIMKEILDKEREINLIKESKEKIVNSAFTMFQGDFERKINEISQKTADEMREQTAVFNSSVESLKAEIANISQNIANLSSRAENLSKAYTDITNAHIEQESELEKRAELYFKNISSLYAKIKELNPEFFEQRAFSEVGYILDDLKNNINAGRYEAAFISGQFGILKASNLLTRLIVESENNNQKVFELMNIAKNLKLRFDQFDPSCEGMLKFELDGENYEYEYNIDYWSEGRFSLLQKDFESAWQQLNDAQKKPVPMEKIKLLEKNLIELDKQLTECDKIARNELIGSQNSREVAARLYESLSQNNWRLKKYGYEENDERNPYSMILQDASGNDISIVVSPGTDVDNPNIYFEAFTDEESHANIIKENVINSVLPDEGLHLEELHHLDDCSANSDSKDFIKNTLPKALELNEKRRKNKFKTQSE